MPLAVKAAVNPADTSEQLILFDNGLLRELGGVPAVPQQNIDDWTPGSAPLVTEQGFRKMYALVVTDWTEPSGYVMSNDGFVFAFGTATQPALEPGDVSGGNDRSFIDLVMDPAANGEGYAVRYNGTIEPSGGAVAIENRPIPHGIARRIYMPDFTTREYWVLDGWGRFFARHGAPAISVNGFPSEGALWFEDVAMGAAILDDTGTGWLGHRWGFVASMNGAQDPAGWQSIFRDRDPVFSDIVVLEDGLSADPLRIGLLSIYGFIHEFIASTAPVVIVAGEAVVDDTTRPQIPFTFQDPEGDAMQAAQLRIFESSVYDVGTNEVQTLQITGTPTGGNVVVGISTPSGRQTFQANHNSSDATVQGLIEALAGVEVGDVAVAGGSWPANTLSVTFQARMGKHNWPVMSLDVNNLTGGTTPTLVVGTTTAGVGIDPETADAIYEDNLTAEDRDVRLFELLEDLENGNYRAYVRAQDTSELWSDWAFWQWEQDVTRPATPTVAATLEGDVGAVLLDVTAASITAGARFGIQYRDDEAFPWRWVLDGWELVPDGQDHASVMDHTARYGVERTYRAVQYVPDPVNVGEFSALETALVESDEWTLVDPFGSSSLVLTVNGDKAKRWTRTVVAKEWWPDGRPNGVVMSSGGPRSRRVALEVYTLSQGEYDAVERLLGEARLYLLRDPFGRDWYVKLRDDVQFEHITMRPLPDEDFPIGHVHAISLPVTEVDRPVAGPTTGPLALLV